jgi:hypothetical protein
MPTPVPATRASFKNGERDAILKSSNAYLRTKSPPVLLTPVILWSHFAAPSIFFPFFLCGVEEEKERPHGA